MCGSIRSIRKPAFISGSANTSPRPIPAVLKVVLKVKPGLGEGYHWVECGGCEAGWQVPYYAVA